MNFTEAMQEMQTMGLGEEFDVVFVDSNAKNHRLRDFSSFSEELVDWLKSSYTEEGSVVCSEDEEAIILNVGLNSNELSYLLDGEVPFYYPEYTDDYYGGLAEGTCHSFAERMTIVKARRACVV